MVRAQVNKPAFFPAIGAAVVIVLATGSASLAADESSAMALYARTVDAICTIRTRSPAKPETVGSGFVVSADGLVASSLHVVEGAEAIRVKCGKGKFADASLASFDREADLVVLRTTPTGSRPLRISDNSGDPPVGQGIYVIGNPEGLESTMSSGLVSGMRQIGGVRLIQISAPVSHGSSGGPVMLEGGEVIGVTLSQLASGQNLNFAVPARQLKQLIRRAYDARPRTIGGTRSGGKLVEKPRTLEVVLLSRSFWEDLDWSKISTNSLLKDVGVTMNIVELAEDAERITELGERSAQSFLGIQVHARLLARRSADNQVVFLSLDKVGTPDIASCKRISKALEEGLGPATTSNDLSWARAPGEYELASQWAIGKTRINWYCALVLRPFIGSEAMPWVTVGLSAWPAEHAPKVGRNIWVRCSGSIVMKGSLRGYSDETPIPFSKFVYGINEEQRQISSADARPLAEAKIEGNVVRFSFTRGGRTVSAMIDRSDGRYAESITRPNDRFRGEAEGSCEQFDPSAKKF